MLNCYTDCLSWLHKKILLKLGFFFYTMAFLSPPNTPSPTNTGEHKCNVCQKLFKSNAGLARHNTVIRKYNILRKGLSVVPKNITKLFKNDLI